MNIDIIIPVYKNASLTKKCITSIFENINEIKEFSPRLLVINDSPDDVDVNLMLADLSISNPEVKIFTNIVNSGFVKSVNKGLEISTKEGRDVILVNSDTETFRGTLCNLVDVAYSDPLIGFVSPRSNNASICSLPHFFGGALPTPVEAFKRWKKISTTLPKFHFVPTAIGFYLYIKNEVLSNIGLLNENFGVGYEEENDLIMRANKVGYRAALANRSFAYHAGSASFNLLDLELQTHRNNNLQKICAIHPEFLPLVQRYETSPHFRAERLLTELIGADGGKIKLAIDLSSLGCHHNGTNELALAIIKSLNYRHSHIFQLNIICHINAFNFHGLNELSNVFRVDPNNPGKHAIAIRLGQPFEQDHINISENLAPINIFAMLDTIAEDCGNLSITYSLTDYWQHISKHVNGIIFISKFSEQTFCTRYPDALAQPKYTRLLPTRLSSYEILQKSSDTKHVLILGNHFAHKASDTTAVELSRVFNNLQFVVIGANTFDKGNLRGYRSGTLDSETISRLFSEASIVVLPSYVEGFGFGLLHSLAAHKVILARNIPVTIEILNTYKKVDGVFLYKNNTDINEAFIAAMNSVNSAIDDSTAIGWDEWVDGMVEFCKLLLSDSDLFPRLLNRISAGDMLRKSTSATPTPVTPTAAPKNLASLMQLEDLKFVEAAYLIYLKRKPDHEGLTQHLAKLRRNIPKVRVLMDIRFSQEGKKVGVKFTGLLIAFIRYKILRIFSSFVI